MKTLVALVIVSAAFVLAAHAQSGPLPLGTVTVSKNQWTCNTQGQYAAQWAPGLTCQHAYVSCPTVNGVSVATLGITFGYATPSTPLGTIVFFSGEDGTTPNGGKTPSSANHPISDYAVDYLADGYQVIQTAWDFEWADPTGNDAGGNIGYAACRPATFLYWVYTAFYLPIQQQNPTAGMCMHGESAGAGAGAFALAWYGAGTGTGQGLDFLDKATFISGPPLSDIKAGCMVPNNNPQVTVCPSGQLGCGHTSSSWMQSEEYTNAINAINDWSGLPYCRGSMNTNS